MSSISNALKACAEPVRKIDESHFTKAFVLAQSFLGFKGHFEGKAVLPAVVQILMAQLTIAEITNKNLQLQEVVQAKFVSPIAPDNKIICNIIPKEDTLWQCSILVNESIAAKFSLRGVLI